MAPTFLSQPKEYIYVHSDYYSSLCVISSAQKLLLMIKTLYLTRAAFTIITILEQKVKANAVCMVFGDIPYLQVGNMI